MAVFFLGIYFRAGCPVREARSKPVEMSNNKYKSQVLCTMLLKVIVCPSYQNMDIVKHCTSGRRKTVTDLEQVLSIGTLEPIVANSPSCIEISSLTCP